MALSLGKGFCKGCITGIPWLFTFNTPSGDFFSLEHPKKAVSKQKAFPLPQRLWQYLVNKNDILISKLEGKISYTLICHDIDNLIVTNGVSIIRPNDDTSLYIIFNNIIRDHFKIQHYSLTTGSIMATLSDTDLLNTILDCDETNTEITKKIIDTIYFFTHNY